MTATPLAQHHTIAWDHLDQMAAQSEGWDLFECGSIDHDPCELQRIDLPEPGECRYHWPNDTAARRWVVARALAGGALHVRALLFLLAYSPGEFARVLDHWRTPAAP